jgi:exosortase/archaeosortase family protein
MKLNKSTRGRLLQKLLTFLGLFVIVSGTIGSWLVPTRLLYGFGFYIYGNLGKMVLLSSIVFVLLAKERLGAIKEPQWRKTNIIYLVAAFIYVLLFFYLGGLLLHLRSFNTNILLSYAAHGVLISIPLLLFLGIFGFKFLLTFIKQFYKEILICIVLSIVFDLGIFQVWKLWPYLSGGVLETVKFLLSLSFPDVQHVLPLTLIVGHFEVSVLQACSGLDSLFMFTALYAFIGLVDHKRLNVLRFVLIYPFAALGMYLINILRVYLLIVIGVTISPDLAIHLFHTYAGMILFIIYFGVFWKLAYKWLMTK